MADSTLRADRRRLRQRLRAERRAVSAAERARRARAICRHIQSLGAFKRARCIALYLAFDGEPDLTPLIQSAAAQRKELYVPVITRAAMSFAQLAPRAALARNFFGILEPDTGRQIDPRTLDLVLTPLVAFDSHGTRIGVGRGYYDRCFSFLRQRGRWQRPKLLGVGYELQHVPDLEVRDWDVPLWGAVTEAGVRRFGGRASE
ncbi:MAG TPA: 5-formyltetrahydrofolate cyclo-ligase [Gammaproteobacteria bacterium]|nr:5-formyltetrahydrofolate cyclo-ligase [Gammaproteobacteria bacterium]